jgi:hypothetical protein
MNNFITKPFAKMSTLQLSDYGGENAGNINIYDLDEIEQKVKDGIIKFAEGAKIYLGGCNCGTNVGGTSFAERLAQVTGAEVLAIAGDRVSSHIARKEGNLVFTPSDWQDTEFKRFKKNEFPKSAGRKINLIDEFVSARRSTTMLEKVTPKNALSVGTTSNLQPITTKRSGVTNEKISKKDAKVLFKNITKE